MQLNGIAPVSLAFIGIDYYFDISPLTANASVQTGGGYQYEFKLNNRGLLNDTFDFTLPDATLTYAIYDKDGIASNNITLLSETTNTFYVQVDIPDSGFLANNSEIFSLTITSQGNVSQSSMITLTTQAKLPVTDKLVPIADAFGYTSLIPINDQFEYSYAQTIYTPDQIGRKGYISKLMYYYAGTADVSTQLDIYLGHTSRKEFFKSSDWIPQTELTQIFSGNYTFTQGLNVIPFDATFNYNGTKNLVVAIDENSASMHSHKSSFNITDIQTNRTISVSDSSNPDPGTPPTGELHALYPNIELYFKEAYDYEISTLKPEAYANTGKAYTYVVQIDNIGRSDDTYQLSINNGSLFDYRLRDMNDSQDITEISVQSDQTASFIVKVLMPIVGVDNGDHESIWLKSVSVNKPSMVQGMDIKTTARIIPLKVATPSYDWKSYETQSKISYLDGMWGTSGSNLTVVGNHGTIISYDGAGWTQVESGTVNDLHSIYGVSANDMYAVGDRGTILKYDGTNWSKVHISQPHTLYKVWGDASDNFYAVGDKGIVLHYDGSSWNEMATDTFNDLLAIWGDSQGSLYAVGASGVILSYIGNQWIELVSPVTKDLLGIWGASASSIYAVGSGGTIIHYDGTDWTELTTPIREDLHGIWGTQDDDIYVSTDLGQIYHYDGSHWAIMYQTKDYQPLFGVWGLSETQVFTFGTDNTVLEYDSEKWTLLLSEGILQPDVNCVWGFSQNNILAVGSHGHVYHYDGTNWSGMTSNVHDDLNTVWGVSANNFYISGNNGILLHYDGTGFTKIKSRVSKNLYSTWGTSTNNFYIVGESGTMISHRSDLWSRLTTGTTDHLYGVWGLSENDVYIVGVKGLILHYDGNSFTTMDNTDDSDLHCIWGSSASNIYAVGDKGTVLHYDGSIWTKIDAPIRQTLTYIHGNSANDIYAVGVSGTVYHYDGTSWKLLSNHITRKNLYSIWSTSGYAVAVGQEKTLLSYQNSNFADMNPELLTNEAVEITKVYYSGIWGDSLDNIVVVGGNGTAMHYTGVNWEKVNTHTNNDLSDVWGRSSSDIYATGEGGTICHYDGSSWSAMPRKTVENLHSIYGFAGNEMFAVGDNGTILQYTGSDWLGMSSTTFNNLKSVWGVSSNDAYAVGDYGTVVKYDGSQWSVIDIGIYDFLYSVWGFSSNDVYVAGESGLIMHFDGTNWTQMRTGITSAVISIRGTAENQLYAVGEGGIILEYRDNVWKKVQFNITTDLNDCWGMSDNLFVAGSKELLYHGKMKYTSISDQKMTIVDDRLFDNIEFRLDNLDSGSLSIEADSSNTDLLTNDNITINCTSNNCVMRLTPNAVCEKQETLVTLVGTDTTGIIKTKTFNVIVTDKTIGSCIQENTAVLRVVGGPIHTHQGARIQVPVQIKIPQSDTNSYPPVSSFGFDIQYPDNKLFYTGYDTTDANAAIPFQGTSGSLIIDSSVKGMIQINAVTNGAGYAPTKTGDILLTLNFSINLEADEFHMNILNISGDILNWPFSNGVFVAGYNGDINGDDMVTPIDALCAFEKFMYLGTSTITTCNIPSSEVQCDVNADGICTPADAFCIMSKYMGEANCIDGK